MADKDDPNVSMYELQRVVDKIGKLRAALRAAGFEVVVTTDVSINFTVRLDEPKVPKKARQSSAK
jgi:hypothetical protein